MEPTGPLKGRRTEILKGVQERASQHSERRGNVCLGKSKQNAFGIFSSLHTSVLLLRMNDIKFCQFQMPSVKLQVKAKRHFFFLPEIMSCEKHFAVPCMNKSLNKCHCLHMKIRRVIEDRLRTLRGHNTLICCRGAQPRCSLKLPGRPSDSLMLGSHT